MRLAEFILDQAEAIVAEWESFAKSTHPGGTMDSLALRDHAEDILRATARDMQSPQSLIRQAEKSRGHGHGDVESDRLDDASVIHAVGRVESGFVLDEVVAEYRALRASVLRLWRESNPAPDQNDIDDITRFNESIDQSLRIAVSGYTRRVEQARRMFLAILSHDLRSPLSAITLSAELAESQIDASAREPHELLSTILTSAQAMSGLIDDLLDFAQSGLGGAIPVHVRRFEIDALCREVINESRHAHPDRTINAECGEKLIVQWDAARIRQVISNLLNNALQHGRTDTPVEIRIHRRGDAVQVAVCNQGNPIPPQQVHAIFDPLTRVAAINPPDHRAFRGSIGLGLYIAKAIVEAHGGAINVTSTAAEGTCFTVDLPMVPPPASAA